jgi:hypothetical protein
VAQPRWRAPLALALIAAPCGGAARIVALHTHCGVLSAHVDGKLWLAHPPLSDGSGNPPPGWGFNDTRGRWRTYGPRRAEFRSESGRLAHFILAPAGAKDPAAGCE